jgi:microsomal epoxide hydrolase
VFEFHKAVEPLTHPERFGASTSDAFDVVIPSLPGFGFSSKPVERPIGPSGTAQLWNKLMTNVLGYRKYGAQGGDWGAAVTMQLAQLFPDVLYGIHLNAASGRAFPEPEQTPEERRWAQSAAAYRAAEFDYYYEQQRKPQTVAFALSDNPLGAAAWMIEKFKVWSDSDQNPEPTFTKDELITNIMIYLTTDTMGSAIWFYRGALEDNKRPRAKITVPTGFAAFPKEMVHLRPPKSWLERDFNLVQYTAMPKGGHFACLEQPGLLVSDVRKFFRRFRG